MYAVWAPKTITLTWSLEYQMGVPPLAHWGVAGDTGPRTTTITYSEGATIGQAFQTSVPQHSLVGPDRVEFRGWYVSPSSSTGILHGSEGRVTADSPLPVSDTTYYARFTDFADVTWDANGGQWVDGKAQQLTKTLYGDVASAYDVAPHRKGWSFAGWSLDEDGEAIEFPIVVSGPTTYYARWIPLIDADVSSSVTLNLDILGIEGSPSTVGVIRSLSGAPLKVASVAFSPLQGAVDLFGDNRGAVLVKGFVDEDASAGFAFALDAVSQEDDPSRLSAFVVLPLATLDVHYMLLADSYVSTAIDPARFEGVTTPVCSVSYTVALAN